MARPLTAGGCVILAALLGACGSEQADERPPVEVPAQFTAETLRNAEFQPAALEGQSVTLSQGVFAGSIEDWGGEVMVSLSAHYAMGDVDGDGDDDAVTVLAISLGGTGTFYDLVLVLNENGTPRNTSSVALGDRVIIESIEITDGTISIALVMHGPADPMCCPSERETREFVVEDGQLLELEFGASAN